MRRLLRRLFVPLRGPAAAHGPPSFPRSHRWRRPCAQFLAALLGLAALSASIFYAVLVGLRISRQATCLASRQVRRSVSHAPDSASLPLPRSPFRVA